MPAPAEIQKLVERFELHRDDYRSPKYNETQLRREFVDPMFKALGWDIDNEQGFAEAYKDVVHEDAIKVADSTKAPDYCFRIGGTRKFFLEAKRPAEDIATNPAHAYQLRRYAWSAKLPLSILTDFEEFAVYDTRIKPGERDKASQARVLFLKFSEYLTRWDEIASIFARDAVLKGSFDRYADSTKSKRGTSEVDTEFLKEIEDWRLNLARNLALRNPTIEQRELNFAVQRIIDRIIFLRIAEARSIEDFGRLQSLLNGARVYARLGEQFRAADDRYNSGLFHFSPERGRNEPPDELTLSLKIDDDAIKDIIRRLYYPHSPYEFSVVPADILGQVYEQFLGKVIRLTAGHQAKVEEKPEVKKAGGVYYTPTFIVDYIVRQTVGRLLQGKTPKDAAKLKILDPACGSGSFLIGAYQFLLDWHRDWYVENRPEQHPKEVYQSAEGWRLTTALRKQILLNNIYGVDIDAQAVEVTKLSLLLKVLEGESRDSLDRQQKLFHQRALPDLGENIKCGNSLIGPDFYEGDQLSLFDADEQYRINAFDWRTEFKKIMKSGGFDAVIGNPPYDVLEKDRGLASWPHSALAEYVKKNDTFAHSLGGKLNLFRFFVIKSIELTRKCGRLGMIIPLALLADISCARTRRQLLLRTKDLEADCFPQKDNPNRRVFWNAKLSTAVVLASVANGVDRKNARIKTRVYPWNSFDDRPKTNCVRFRDTTLLDPENMPIPLTDASNWSLCMRLHRKATVVRLVDVGDFTVARGEINQTICREFIRSDKRGMKRLLKGGEIGRFRQNATLKQGIREWFDEAAFLAAGLEKPIAYVKRIATQRITGVDERLRIVATIVDPPAYFADSTNSIAAAPTSKYRLEYLLGLLNSKLFQWRFKIVSTNNNVGTNELLSMPFRLIDFANKVDRVQYNRMVDLVKLMLELHEKYPSIKIDQAKAVFERHVASVDQQIDQLVYELYGLTDKEIALVEEATTR